TPLPDVLHAETLRRAEEVGVSCCVDLEDYARGRATGASKLRHAALLPKEIALMDSDDCIREFREWLRTKVHPSRPTVVPAVELLSRWSEKPVKRLGRDDMDLCATLLENLGYGVEPDPRRETSAITDTESVAIFVL